jgi:hypothetical protein
MESHKLYNSLNPSILREIKLGNYRYETANIEKELNLKEGAKFLKSFYYFFFNMTKVSSKIVNNYFANYELPKFNIKKIKIKK